MKGRKYEFHLRGKLSYLARIPLADYSIRNCYLKNMSQLCEIMELSDIFFSPLLFFEKISKNKYMKNRNALLGGQCASIIISFK